MTYHRLWWCYLLRRRLQAQSSMRFRTMLKHKPQAKKWFLFLTATSPYLLWAGCCHFGPDILSEPQPLEPRLCKQKELSLLILYLITWDTMAWRHTYQQINERCACAINRLSSHSLDHTNAVFTGFLRWLCFRALTHINPGSFNKILDNICYNKRYNTNAS